MCDSLYTHNTHTHTHTHTHTRIYIYYINKNLFWMRLIVVQHVIIIIKCFLHQHIRIISEGSCDVIMIKLSFEITGINYILKYFQIKSSFFLIVKIFQNVTVFAPRGSNKCRLGEQKRHK